MSRIRRSLGSSIDLLLQRVDDLKTAAADSPTQFEPILDEALAELAAGLDEILTTHPPVSDELQQRIQTGMEELLVTEEELLQSNRELFKTRLEAESERQLYRDLFDSAPDGYLVTDEKGIIREANRAAGHLLGVRPGHLAGKPLIVFVAPGDREAFLQRLARLRQAEPSTPAEEAGKPPDWEIHLQPRLGDPIPVAISLSRGGSPDGRPGNLLWLLHDLTDRNRLQEQLRRAQRLESLGLMAGGVAHEFNNLLTAILGFAELAEEETIPETLAHQHVAHIMIATDRAAVLTRKLLTFARRQPAESKTIRLDILCREMEELLRRFIHGGIVIRLMADEDLWPVRTDPGQMGQVLINLVANARDAMPDGGKLTIETRNITVRAQSGQRACGIPPGDYVALIVRDTGMGMDEVTQERLFEPFYSTKAPGMGTGLGLSTCYGIITQNAGHIRVSSKAGQGTAFKVYLPRAHEPAETLPESPASLAPSQADTAGPMR